MKTLTNLTVLKEYQLLNINGGDGDPRGLWQLAAGAGVAALTGGAAIPCLIAGYAAGVYWDYWNSYYSSHPAPKYINPAALVE
jgi:hypothetical protein